MARLSLQKLNEYLRPHYRELWLGIIALLVVNGLAVWITEIIRSVIKSLGGNTPNTSLFWYTVGIVALASLMWCIRMASRLWMFGIGRSVEFDLRQKIFNHLLRLPPSYFAQQSAGDLISIVTSDVENIRRLLGFALLSSINTLFAYALTLPAMLAIDVRLSLLALAPYPFMMLLVQSFGGKLRDEQQYVQESLSDISTLLQEDLNGMALIKTYAQEENEQRAFYDKNQILLEANLQMARTRNFLFPLLAGIAGISLLIILLVGGGMLVRKQPGFELDGLIALIRYVEYLTFPTAILGFTITIIQRGQVSIDRIEAVLCIPPAITDPVDVIPISLPKAQGKIKVENLSFTYPDATQPTLKDINFVIAPGETVAIIGAIGSGKTTLANLLPRLQKVEPGTISIDDVDITTMKIEDLRSLITYVPQESFLFSAPIIDNIRYGKPDASPAEVEYYAEQAHIQKEILYFPQQYQTLVGERGITLSGGQRQRTALARALLVDSPILLLDDALSSVDNQTASNILVNLPQNKTVIFITHKLSAAMNADRILVLDRGAVQQIGTHRELLENSPIYNKLWSLHKLEESVKE